MNHDRIGALDRMPLPEAARLAPPVDAGRLAAELAGVTGHRWRPQRIRTPGGGVGPATTVDWRVLPLHSLGGDPDRTDPGGPGPVDYAPTVWLARQPYLREILATIPAPLNAVRLMALGPGASSHAHNDPKYALDRGFVRLHLPIVTHPNAILVLDGVKHCWQPGEIWFGDFSREHQVRNAGPLTRVHAVIDALLTKGLAEWFPTYWQAAFAQGIALFNRCRPTTPHSPVAAARRTAALPHGFIEFDHDNSLDGPLCTVEIMTVDGGLALVTPERVLALVPVGPDEYRFTGWSEQRTIVLTDLGLLLRVRHGGALWELAVSAMPCAG